METEGSTNQDLVAALRKLTPEQRLLAAIEIYNAARQLKAAGFRALHPDWDEAQIRQAVRQVFRKHEADC